jgi:hypothetical protein
MGAATLTSGPIESSFLTEVRAQWLEAIRIRRAAEADGDSWLAELMNGRLEDLKDQVARNGVIVVLDPRPAEVAC